MDLAPCSWNTHESRSNTTRWLPRFFLASRQARSAVDTASFGRASPHHLLDQAHRAMHLEGQVAHAVGPVAQAVHDKPDRSGGVGQVGVGHEDDELVAAHAAQVYAALQHLVDTRADPPQHLAAPPFGVVDQLEAVQVQVGQRQAVVLPRAAAPVPARPDAAAVEHLSAGRSAIVGIPQALGGESARSVTSCSEFPMRLPAREAFTRKRRILRQLGGHPCGP